MHALLLPGIKSVVMQLYAPVTLPHLPCCMPCCLQMQVIKCWAKILQRVPGSRLVLKNKPFACETAKVCENPLT